MAQASRHPAVDQLAALVGVWEVRVTTGEQTIGPERTTFHWLDGTSFLRQHTVMRSDPGSLPPAWAEHAPSAVTALVGFDDTAERFQMLYADSRGVHRIYQMSLGDGVWRLWRESPGFHQRFTGRFSDDLRAIDGRWEISEDGEAWRVDFDLTYTRVG